MTRKPIDRMTLIHWYTQIADEYAAWLKANTEHRPEIIEAYRAGVLAGCRNLIATLTLHDHLAVMDS